MHDTFSETMCTVLQLHAAAGVGEAMGDRLKVTIPSIPAIGWVESGEIGHKRHLSDGIMPLPRRTYALGDCLEMSGEALASCCATLEGRLIEFGGERFLG